jgi:hypothetical protein
MIGAFAVSGVVLWRTRRALVPAGEPVPGPAPGLVGSTTA